MVKWRNVAEQQKKREKKAESRCSWKMEPQEWRLQLDDKFWMGKVLAPCRELLMVSTANILTLSAVIVSLQSLGFSSQCNALVLNMTLFSHLLANHHLINFSQRHMYTQKSVKSRIAINDSIFCKSFCYWVKVWKRCQLWAKLKGGEWVSSTLDPRCQVLWQITKKNPFALECNFHTKIVHFI